jgi:CubicO group peptidase (beta-lactamase class C family)
VFQVGSITKIWTATMIMQLVDEGLLSLDTTVSEVLPGARLGTADVGGQVTVRHLLTHTSGIDGDVFTDTGRGDYCVERFSTAASPPTASGCSARPRSRRCSRRAPRSPSSPRQVRPSGWAGG